MSDNVELDYEYLAQKALRQVIIDVLSITAEMGGAPGEHHFYIEFMTTAPGVSIPEHLQQSYPERMTIVLQHQFANLTVEQESFSVTLSFKGKPSDLTIPFDAVTSFADPSVEFGLRFEPVAQEEASKADSAKTDIGAAPISPTAASPTNTSTQAPGETKDADASDGDKNGDKDGNDAATDENAAPTSADVVSLDAFRKK